MTINRDRSLGLGHVGESSDSLTGHVGWTLSPGAANHPVTLQYLLNDRDSRGTRAGRAGRALEIVRLLS